MLCIWKGNVPLLGPAESSLFINHIFNIARLFRQLTIKKNLRSNRTILGGVAILQGLQNAMFVIFVFGRAGYIFCNLGQVPDDCDQRIYVTFFFPFLEGDCLSLLFSATGGFLLVGIIVAWAGELRISVNERMRRLWIDAENEWFLCCAR